MTQVQVIPAFQPGVVGLARLGAAALPPFVCRSAADHFFGIRMVVTHLKAYASGMTASPSVPQPS